MPLFIAAIDTNILFSKKCYFIKFKGYEIKYIPGWRKGLQDDLLLKMEKKSQTICFPKMKKLLPT